MSFNIRLILIEGFLFMYFIIRIRDQPIQSSPSVYGRFIRRVLGLKALVKAFFVKP